MAAARVRPSPRARSAPSAAAVDPTPRGRPSPSIGHPRTEWEQAADDLAMMLGAIVTGLNNTGTAFSGTQRRIVAAFSG